jgi:exodeoxyribonuclease V alpha subunit
MIIDEASMIDEVLLAALFTMINPDSLKHLIIVGDEKQLPPIGIERPFLDVLNHLKKNHLDNHWIYLESNLRFGSSASLGKLANLFGDTKDLLPAEIIEVFQHNDDRLELHYFSNNDELNQVLKSAAAGRRD